eukprot:COSAG05_NODE_968_length_6393_cov_22.036066_2_plen_43_part_00
MRKKHYAWLKAKVALLETWGESRPYVVIRLPMQQLENRLGAR